MTAAPSARFKPYAAYKDSGVEWLGEIPAHWECNRLRYVTHLNPIKSEVRGLHPQLPVSFVPMEAVGEYGGLTLDAVNPLGASLEGYTYFRDGDVIVAKITPCFENGKGALAAGLENGIGFGTTELHVLRAAEGTDARFVFYLTLSDHFRRLGTATMYGAGGQKRVPEDFIRNLRHPLPSEPEQRAIAAFLDHETARIDALVAKKVRLIELLREKRTALITRAVTKGLDPDVPMKDSGVEWLGEIPAHWRTFRFKLLFKDIYRYPTYYDIDYLPEGVPEVRGEALVDGRIIELPDQRYISAKTNEQFPRTVLREGDLVMSVRGTMGKVGLVLRQFAGANITANLVKLSPREDLATALYLSWVMRSEFFLKSLDKQAPQTTIQTITMPQLTSIILPIPALAAQRAIAAFLDRETARIDALVAKVRDAIARLKELRTALISAAVTGKIDVREHAA